MKRSVQIFDMRHYGDAIRIYHDISPTLMARMGTGGNSVPLCFCPLVTSLPNMDAACVYDDRMHTDMQDKKTFCLAENSIGRQIQNGCNGTGVIEGRSYTLNATGVHGVMAETEMRVRRLTPRECERLQGFDDDWTLISWRGKDLDKCPDAPRYKAIGNSWAVPVVRWIGQRMYDCLSKTEKKDNSTSKDSRDDKTEKTAK